MADFWQNPSLEPKRAFKFVLSIAGGASGINIPQFLVKKVSKPSFTVSESEHKYLNHSFWFPGKVAWNEVSFTIVDVLGESDGTRAFVELFQEMGYSLPTNPAVAGGLQTISKASAVNAWGEVRIQQIDSQGEIREEWKLNNCWVKDVKFGELDYESEEMLNVEVALRYDNASLKSSLDKTSAPVDVLTTN